MGAPQGNLNPGLYALAASPQNGVYHDVTVASSGVSGCNVAVPSLCNNSTPGSTGLGAGLSGFLVGNGYDLATGWGSIDLANLLAQWSSVAGSVNLDQLGLTGAWYDANESGQGLLLQVVPDFGGDGKALVFGGWFTFDISAGGGQRWYTIQGLAARANASATLPVYATYGGNFNAGPIVTATQVGEAVLQFTDCTHGTLAYRLTDGGNSRDNTIPLTRLGNNITCAQGGDNGAKPANYLLSGAWYDHNTSGQGLVFDLDPIGNNLFAAWYTFAPMGQNIGGGASQRWFTLQLGGFAPGTSAVNAVPIYETTGGVFDNPTHTHIAQVGTADLAFQNCNSMTLTYRFTSGENVGQSATIALAHPISARADCHP
jgi:hypothetical protein